MNLGGGKRTAECALQNHFWRPQKLGLVWSVPLSFKGNDIGSPKRGGGKRIVGGGVQKRFGEGSYAEFTVCFPPPPPRVFHPPLPLSENCLRAEIVTAYLISKCNCNLLHTFSGDGTHCNYVFRYSKVSRYAILTAMVAIFN